MQSAVEVKPWGAVLTRQFTPSGLKVDECLIGVGGFSSIHAHLNLHNTFLVHEGLLMIDWRSQGDWVRTSLSAGEQLTVCAGTQHRFVNNGPEHVRLSEVYHGGRPVRESDPFDIVRYTSNGASPKYIEHHAEDVAISRSFDDLERPAKWRCRLTGLCFNSRGGSFRCFVEITNAADREIDTKIGPAPEFPT